jgi:hypothetical protein
LGLTWLLLQSPPDCARSLARAAEAAAQAANAATQAANSPGWPDHADRIKALWRQEADAASRFMRVLGASTTDADRRVRDSFRREFLEEAQRAVQLHAGVQGARLRLGEPAGRCAPLRLLPPKPGAVDKAFVGAVLQPGLNELRIGEITLGAVDTHVDSSWHVVDFHLSIAISPDQPTWSWQVSHPDLMGASDTQVDRQSARQPQFPVKTHYVTSAHLQTAAGDRVSGWIRLFAKTHPEVVMLEPYVKMGRQRDVEQSTLLIPTPPTGALGI